MKLKLFLLFIIYNLSFCIVASATIRYVSKTGSSTPPYTSWATASDSIQKCINICQSGDTVYVGKGTYIELIRMIDGLTLIGAGWDSCRIDTRTISAPTNFYSINMRDSSSIEGFHIIARNTMMEGTGIRCFPGTNDPLYFYGEIRNNKISLAAYGIRTNNAFLTIKNNFIEICDRGIRVDALDSSVLDSIYENYLFNIRSIGIGTGLGCRAVIFNNYVQMNSDLPTAIGISSWAPSKVYNNIMTNVELGGEGFDASSLPTEVINNLSYHFNIGIDIYYTYLVRNNIVQKNNSGFRNLDSTPPNAKYNNTWNNKINYNGFVPDSTNLSVDPMFVNEDSLNYYLQMFSQLIDAGDPGILDKDGTRSDIGLYGGPFGESYKYIDLAPKPPRGLTALVDSLSIRLSWKENTESDFNHYKLFSDTIPGFTADSTTLLAEVTDTVFVYPIPTGVKKIYFKLSAVDNQGNESKLSEEIGVFLVSADDENPQIIQDYMLYQNYPNPFNPATKIAFRLKESGYVKLYVYDIKGELVNVLVNQHIEAGYHEVEFSAKEINNTADISSGMYIYQIDIKNGNGIPVFRDTKKMLYLK